MNYPAENVWISDVKVFVKLHRCGVEGALVLRTRLNVNLIETVNGQKCDFFFSITRHVKAPVSCAHAY